MAIDIEKHEKLREAYKKESGKPFEETLIDISNTVDFGEENPSWAEWGYVLWLEKQVLDIR